MTSCCAGVPLNRFHGGTVGGVVYRRDEHADGLLRLNAPGEGFSASSVPLVDDCPLLVQARCPVGVGGVDRDDVLTGVKGFGRERASVVVGTTDDDVPVPVESRQATDFTPQVKPERPELFANRSPTPVGAA